jgi:hypothetical protein
MSSEKELPVFVKYRVREINQENDIAFGYVKSTKNLADSADLKKTIHFGGMDQSGSANVKINGHITVLKCN